MHTGKWIAVLMVAGALALATFSWWFRYASTRQVAEFWGPRTSTLIRDADVVEVFLLRIARQSPPEGLASVATIDIGNQQYSCEARQAVTSAPGMVHLRHALLEDRSFDWQSPADATALNWRYGLTFRRAGDDAQVTLLFSQDFGHVVPLVAGTARQEEATSSAPIAAGLREVFGELLPASE